jgi:hypothetical protein
LTLAMPKQSRKILRKILQKNMAAAERKTYSSKKIVPFVCIFEACSGSSVRRYYIVEWVVLHEIFVHGGAKRTPCDLIIKDGQPSYVNCVRIQNTTPVSGPIQKKP